MTSQEYIAQLSRLIRDGRDEDALAFAARVGPEIVPKLTPEDFFHVAGMLEGAELAVTMTRAEETASQSGDRMLPDAATEAPSRTEAAGPRQV